MQGKKMIISCPNCKTRYSIEDDIITQEGVKFSCAVCDFVWKEDSIENKIDDILEEKQEETLEENNAEKIEDIEQEFSLPENLKKMTMSVSYKDTASYKDKAKEIIETKKNVNLSKVMIYLLFIISVIVFIFVNRYYIAQKLPLSELLFEQIGLEVKGIAEGLSFQKLETKKYQDGETIYLRVYGTIINESTKEIRLPDLELIIFDKERKPVKVSEVDINVKSLKPGESIDFTIEESCDIAKANKARLIFTNKKER